MENAVGFSYPEFTAVDDDFPSCLFLPEPPLHQVLTVLSRERHVPSSDGRISGTFRWRQEKLRFSNGLEKL